MQALQLGFAGLQIFLTIQVLALVLLAIWRPTPVIETIANTPMKLSRLYQPRNPLFWLMVALNLLSAALSWISQTQSLGVLVSLVMVGFAIGNAVLGTYLMWRLVNS